MTSSEYVRSILSIGFKKFSHIQISDDETDNFIKTSEDASKKLKFKPEIVWSVIETCQGISSVVIAIKSYPNENPSCELFASSMYHPGGYIKSFVSRLPTSMNKNLQSLCISVDLMIDSFSKLTVPCPIEDLRYAVENLTDRHFTTFIQIGFCAAGYTQEDIIMNNILLASMNLILFEMQSRGCRASIDVGADEGYVDMTVEKGNVEYSFAFFYYNPSICDPEKPEESVHDLEFNKDVSNSENIPLDSSKSIEK
uniref:Uncharacterized protein n=1 Tax=Acrobeloides nanus TaxID=290746 RepID=A0A914CZR8_9BILA